MSKLLDDMKKAIKQAEKRGMSRYAICKRAGVAQSVVSKFMAGSQGLGVDVVERLAGALDLRAKLVPVSKKSKSKKER